MAFEVQELPCRCVSRSRCGRCRSEPSLFVAFSVGMPDEQREGLQEELIDSILQVLQRNPQLHYYQGYHDIVVTFLLVVGERLATALVEKLSTHHLRYLPGSLREHPCISQASFAGGVSGRGELLP